ncbi:MAG: helix-turn-helix domain-containing protein [Candidatus Bathyarchaeota archaeon]|nr:helix-turn-helix domain-containing protein [Candidatus Bathyarchaeum sp.]
MALQGGPENSNAIDELSIKLLLVKLIDEVDKLNQKLDLIIEFDAKMLKIHKELLQGNPEQNSDYRTLKLEPDMMTLLSIPNSLRKTVIAIYKLQEATADDLSKETKRLRAVESASANQLVRLGFVNKKREGRKVYFCINASEISE